MVLLFQIELHNRYEFLNGILSGILSLIYLLKSIIKRFAHGTKDISYNFSATI